MLLVTESLSGQKRRIEEEIFDKGIPRWLYCSLTALVLLVSDHRGRSREN